MIFNRSRNFSTTVVFRLDFCYLLLLEYSITRILITTIRYLFCDGMHYFHYCISVLWFCIRFRFQCYSLLILMMN